jgi:hypothetical protein
MSKGLEFGSSYYDVQTFKVLGESTDFYDIFPGFMLSNRLENLKTGYPKLFLRILSVHMK